MPQFASDHLQNEDLNDPLARSILQHAISKLDEYGAWEWNQHAVAASSAFLLLVIRLVMNKKRGIDWYALIHAIISSIGSMICMYLDYTSSEILMGSPEPENSVLCGESLTSLHRILPAITMGYAIFDLFDGLFLGLDFILHGAATFAVMALFVEVNAPQIMSNMLIMETSTIFLNVTKADFFTPAMSIANLVCFFFAFLISRMVIFPIQWYQLMISIWLNMDDERFQSCYPAFWKWACLLFGIFFNCLNFFWFYKIVRKAKRKLKGVERHDEQNGLAEENDKLSSPKKKSR